MPNPERRVTKIGSATRTKARADRRDKKNSNLLGKSHSGLLMRLSNEVADVIAAIAAESCHVDAVGTRLERGRHTLQKKLRAKLDAIEAIEVTDPSDLEILARVIELYGERVGICTTGYGRLVRALLDGVARMRTSRAGASAVAVAVPGEEARR
jgi:hypothetical protein